MNKWEKEVQQSLLNDEQQVLDVLKTAYAGTLGDVQDKMQNYFARIQANPNDTAAIYQYRYQQALQDQIYNILDNLKNQNYQTISEYLEHSYENGWLGAMYDIHRQGIPVIVPINQANAVRAITINSKISVPMYTRLGTDIDRLRVSIAAEVTRGIVSGSTWHDTAARISGQTNISAYNAMRIARTEGHRVQCNAQYDACNSAKQSGADVVNQWDSTMDSRTRDTHRRLHKQLREVGQPFEIDGKKTLYPGAFGVPEEDIHCRCALLQRARWALSESELQQLRNTPEAKALAETENFDQFKNKYLELTENSGNRLTNSGGNGTIRTDTSGFRRIETGEEVNTFFSGNGDLLQSEASMENRWISSLTDDEQWSITNYCGEDFADINNYLRGKIKPKKNRKSELDETIQNIDSAINKFELTENIQVERGVGTGIIDRLTEKYNVSKDELQNLIGKVISEPGYSSTTALCGGLVANNHPVIMQINVPKGMGRGAYVNSLAGLFQDDEYEFLLKRNASFTIADINQEDGKYFIKMVMSDETV